MKSNSGLWRTDTKMRIKNRVKPVRETKEGKSISVYVILDKKYNLIANVWIHHSFNAKGHLKRVDVLEWGAKGGFNQYKGQTLNRALHLAVIAGVRLYDDAEPGAGPNEVLIKYRRAKTDEAKARIVKNAEKSGYVFCNGNERCYYIGGLRRLESFGYKVIEAM